MSILPSFAAIQPSTTGKDPPVEYGIDFDTGQLTGEIVSGLEALKVWIWLALRSERYRYPIYTWQYGAELEKYIGRGYSQEYLNDAIKNAVKECLKVNPHIKGIDNFSCKLERDQLSIEFAVKTDYGEANIHV